jgi:hypothetical protein
MKFLQVCSAACLVTIAFFSGNQLSFIVAQESVVQPDFELKNDPLTKAGPLKKNRRRTGTF